MAAIRPLKGLRYSTAAGELTNLIAPPYDVLSAAQRDDYAARSPYNVVRLTLPESKPDDRSKYVKYARSAAALAEWRREAVLVPEPSAAIYRYRQTFTVPYTKESFTRTSLISLLRLEPFESGVVLPHERTFPKHKEDRLRILEATRAHLETIFGLYEDEQNEIAGALDSASTVGEVSATDDGIRHELAVVVDHDAIQGVQALMQSKRIWIADGHHRYETALAFRTALGERSEEVPEDYIPIALTSMSDPGLVLLPTHRIVPKFAHSSEWVLDRLNDLFNVRSTSVEGLQNEIERSHSNGVRAFGLVFGGGAAYVVTPKDEGRLIESIASSQSPELKQLDVTVLHSAIFETLFEIRGVESLVYTRDSDEAIRAAQEGAAMVWMMNPPSVGDMKTIALGGERMPEKSTYYFPKIQSGLVLWSLNDF